MTPLTIGTGKRRLFAIYTPPLSSGGRARAVVLCPPWGDEYLCAHRPLRHLASHLAAAGIHVLRFDYFGTGDSAGDLQEADLEGWRQDIETALEELKDMSGASRVGLVGMRLGGVLAAGVAVRQPGLVDRLGLWDPVVSGPDYLLELEREASSTAPPRSKPALAGGAIEVHGFPLTPALAFEMRSLNLPALASQLAAPLRIVVSCGEEACRALRARLDGRTRTPVDVEDVPAAPCWANDAGLRAGAVPIDVLRRIVDWFR